MGVLSSFFFSVFDNLLERQFDVSQTDQVYASDITYVWTQEGWLYLAVVIDLCSRKVVVWSMGSRMNAQLVCDALKMALWRRRPKAGLIHHSDRGSQYASKAFRNQHDFAIFPLKKLPYQNTSPSCFFPLGLPFDPF